MSVKELPNSKNSNILHDETEIIKKNRIVAKIDYNHVSKSERKPMINVLYKKRYENEHCINIENKI